MKLLKQIVALMLITALILSGCGKTTDVADEKEAATQTQKTSEIKENDNGDTAKAASGVTYHEDGEGPLTDEKITLTALIPSVGWIEDIETNKMVQLLEEQTNVHIEWIETSKEQMKDKLSIMIASGETPDLVYAGSINKADLEAYGMQGVFADLSTYVDEYAHNLNRVLETKEGTETFMTAADGNQYFMPKIDGAYHMSLPYKLWLNQVWLDTLNLDVPTTTDELRNVLMAFKNDDPNGNGIADEIPLTGSMRSVEDTANALISAFTPVGGGGADGSNNYAFIIDGEPTITADKPEFREGIRYVKSLYEEGLIDQAAFTQSRDQVKPLVDGGEQNRVGGMVSHHPGNFASLSDMENGRFREFAAVAPLKGPEGFQSTPLIRPNDVKVGMAVSADCEYPEIAVMWIDYMYRSDISFMAKQGFEGVHWEKAPEGAIGLNGEPAAFIALPSSANIHEDNSIMGYLGAYNNTGFNETIARGEGFNYEGLLYDATKYLQEPYGVQVFPINIISMTEEDTQKFKDLSKAIDPYITESVDRFIIGDLDIEADWDAYVEQLNDLGLNEYLELMKKYY